jgi:sec-independent protein translocase protein TatA
MPAAHLGSHSSSSHPALVSVQPMDLGPPELIIVLIVVLLVFGANRLPKLARSLGEAQREFRRGQQEASGVDDPSDSERRDAEAD